ncbi:MAG: hypothetical protein IJN13_00675 [Bacilli bacterium]|nr:hypothetical protein [Bacilli bacterium]
MVKIKKELIELRKSGKFYNSFGDDAIILHYLMGYKIVAEKGGVGFPETAFNKVINALEDEEISYKVYEKDNIIAEKDFKKLNSYKSILKKGISELSVEERFNKIEKRIRELNAKELDYVLEVIENAISH